MPRYAPMTGRLCFLLATSALVPGTPAGGQLLLDGPEVQVQADPESSLVRPLIASDAAGRPLICWTREFMWQIHCRLFDSSLVPLRASERVTEDDPILLYSATALASNGTEFAVAWGGFRPSADAILGRVIGPQGRPRGPIRQLNEPAERYRLHPTLTGTPDGSFLAFWTGASDAFGGIGHYGRSFDPDLAPLGSEAFVIQPPGLAPFEAVATASNGRFLLVYGDLTSQGGLFARMYDSLDSPVGPPVRLDQDPARHANYGAAAAALGDRFLVVWTAEAVFGETTVRGRILDSSGVPLGPELHLPQRENGELRLPAVAADPDGGFLVAWDGVHPDDPFDHGIVARRFGRDGSPLSPDLLVNAQRDGIEVLPSAAPLGGGRFVVAWQATVIDDIAYSTIQARALATGRLPPAGPWIVSRGARGFSVKVRISSGSGSIAGAEEPACIPETVCVSGAVPGRSEVFLRVVGPKPNGYLWPTLVKFSTSTVEVWVRQDGTGEVKYYRLEGARPGVDELPGLFDREGFVPVTAGTASSPGFPLTIADPLVLAAGEAPAPSGPVFTSEHFPDFRFRVRISAGGTEQAVRQEAACIEETLCLSAAIPGRSEVFVRIVGPKPNGRLWPTIVKLTTSTLEVWVEQVSTGEERYYRIEGATPGHDDLTGLFDRDGFAP